MAAVPKPIRVFQIIDKLSVDNSGTHGGTQSVVQWLPLFDPTEFQFHMFSLRAPEPAGELFERINIPMTFLDKGKFDPLTLPDLMGYIRREQPHILHMHGYGSTTFGRLASAFTGVSTVLHEHWINYEQPFYQTMTDVVLSSFTNRAVAVSEGVLEYMVKKRSIKPDIIDTFYPGTPIRGFQSASAEVLNQKRIEVGLPPDAPVIAVIGRLAVVKGHVHLFNAAPEIIRAIPNVKFLLVGEGPERTNLEAQARQLGMSDHLIFTGYRSDVLDMIGLANVVAIPSLSEGGPTTFLEAMKMRVPVVGSPVGLMKNGIRDGETGFKVPVGNVKMLAEKLIYMLQNPELARQMGEKSWEVCQQFSAEYAVERLTAIYKDLVAKKYGDKV